MSNVMPLIFKYDNNTLNNKFNFTFLVCKYNVPIILINKNYEMNRINMIKRRR